MYSWREIQKHSFTDIESLLDFLQLSPEKRVHIQLKTPFILNLPLRLAQKIKKNTLDDPILRQFVPLTKENDSNPKDPLKELSFCETPKLLHKYDGRALLIVTSACAMHCRYCFRKNFPYETKIKDFEKELSYIANDPDISEVILSGGDPLSLSNDKLKALIERLSTIPHVKRLRFHTRFPIGIPERIDEVFLQLLKNCALQIWFVTHCNHPLELDDEVILALQKIKHLGIPILNQSVLLRGVNDNANTLKELSNRLINAGFMPYYLHKLDPVSGSAHFEVSEEEGIRLIENLSSQLSGYGVPRYVKEVPGASGKTEIGN